MRGKQILPRRLVRLEARGPSPDLVRARAALFGGMGPALGIAGADVGEWVAWFAGRGETATTAALFAGLHALAAEDGGR